MVNAQTNPKQTLKTLFHLRKMRNVCQQNAFKWLATANASGHAVGNQRNVYSRHSDVVDILAQEYWWKWCVRGCALVTHDITIISPHTTIVCRGREGMQKSQQELGRFPRRRWWYFWLAGKCNFDVRLFPLPMYGGVGFFNATMKLRGNSANFLCLTTVYGIRGIRKGEN